MSILEAGVQWFPTKRESGASTVEIIGYTSEAAYTDLVPAATLDNLGEGGECPHDIAWSFDGTTTGGGGEASVTPASTGRVEREREPDATTSDPGAPGGPAGGARSTTTANG